MIIIYRNVNTGSLSYGVEGLSGSFLADGRAVPASPVWEDTGDAAEVEEIPSGAAAALRERAARKATEEEARRLRDAEEARLKAERDAAYRAWYNSPEQVAKRAREEQELRRILYALRIITKLF